MAYILRTLDGVERACLAILLTVIGLVPGWCFGDICATIYEIAVDRLTQSEYRTVDMIEDYSFRDSYFDVPYLAEDQRADHLVEIEGGRLYLDGRKVNGNYNFVMDLQGNIYVYEISTITDFESVLPEWHHSSLLAGGPVASAGRLYLENGELIGLDNYSGHYRPSSEVFLQVIVELRLRGVSVRDGYRLWSEDFSVLHPIE